MQCVLRILVMATLLAAIPLLAWAGGDSDELEQNRRLLEKWKSDPEHYARLRQELKTFLALPPERQKQLRQLDRELQEENSSTSARLYRVLERYHAWLQTLPPEQRLKIETAASKEERLKQIKAVRKQQWIAQQPKAIKDELYKLPSNRRLARITELQKEERKRRDEWRLATRDWDELQRANRFEKLRPEVDVFVSDSLLPRLSPDEKTQLEQVKGKWPQYPRTLVKLADKYAVELPGPPTGPARFSELPAEVQKYLLSFKNPLPARIEKLEGKWPQYAMALTAWGDSHPKRRLPVQLGPCRPMQFAQPVRQFLNKRLLPALDQEEKEQLNKAEGHWPGYPRVLLKLARAHRLQIPGTALPGPPELWEQFRIQPKALVEALPEVPDHTLREFMQRDLSAEERTKLAAFSLSDPASRQRVKQAYFHKHPNELKKLREADLKNQQKHKAKKE